MVRFTITAVIFITDLGESVVRQWGVGVGGGSRGWKGTLVIISPKWRPPRIPICALRNTPHVCQQCPFLVRCRHREKRAAWGRTQAGRTVALGVSDGGGGRKDVETSRRCELRGFLGPSSRSLSLNRAYVMWGQLARRSSGEARAEHGEGASAKP